MILGGKSEECYLITTIANFTSKHANENNYEITDILLEIAPGRLIFNSKIQFKTKVVLITRTVTKKILETIVHESSSNYGALSSSSLLDSLKLRGF